MSTSRAAAPPEHAPDRVPFRETGGVLSRMRAFLRSPLAVFRRNLEELPYDYHPLAVVTVDIAFLIIGVAACAQRYEYFPTLLPLLALVLLFVPLPLFAFFGVLCSPSQMGFSAWLAAALFLLQPVSTDIAPFVLVVAAGEVAALTARRVSVAFAGISVGLLVAFDLFGHLLWRADAHPLDGLPVYALGILCGWMAGVMMQAQRSSLYREREYQEVRAVQSAAEERRRIAREVHDVIAHSLSITLLHLTAARHTLQTDRDVDEAVDALSDAERLGRQAMADIRRTVGLLGADPAAELAEPGAEDIAELVADFDRAGIRITQERHGDLSVVSAAVGLALYRIAQESLANVAKHAPTASVQFRLRVADAAVTLQVVNNLSTDPPQQLRRGMGLPGMRQRAESLGGTITMGPSAQGWAVQVSFPLTPAQGKTCALSGWTKPPRTVDQPHIPQENA